MTIIERLKKLTPFFRYALLALAVFLLCYAAIQVRSCAKAPEDAAYWKGVAEERAKEAGKAIADKNILTAMLAADRKAYEKAMAEKDGEIDSLYTVLAKETGEKDKAIADKKKALAAADTDKEKVKIQAGIILDLEAKVSQNEMTFAKIIAAKDEEIAAGKVRIHNLELAVDKCMNEIIPALISERDGLKELNASLSKALRIEKAKKTANKPLYALAGYGIGKGIEALSKK